MNGTGAPRPSAVRKAVILLGAALLFVFIGVQGLAAIAARSSSPTLLALFSPALFPAAGSQLAQLHLKLGQPAAATALAKPAALADPINVRTVRTLGQAVETADAPTATRIMRLAERMSWRDTPTALWVLRDAALGGDIPRVLNMVDALARRQSHPEITGRVFYAGLADAPSRRAFADLLARHPPWRAGFFGDVRVNLERGSFSQMEMLFDQLAQTDGPPTAEEQLNFIQRMTDVGDGARARRYWFRSFGVEADRQAQIPFDPGFRLLATRRPDHIPSPFEWRIGPDFDQYVDLRPDDEGPVLNVQPGADAGTSFMSQALVLPPGPHRIDTAVAAGSVPQTPAEWQLLCAPSDTPLIRSFAQRGNRLSGITVTVPASGCDTQALTLVATDRIDARPIAIRSVTVRPVK